jgi:flagellar hook-associated protein 3
MPFRITPQVLYRRSLFDMTNGYQRLAEAQQDISTTKRLRVFSDDAADASRALDLRTTIQRSVQSRASIDDATRASDSQAELLEQVSDLVAQARALGESAASDAKSDSDLKAIAAEIDTILDQLVATANQRNEGRYLFSGSRTDTKSFVAKRSFGRVTGVSYQGDDIVRQVRLGPSELKDIELSGRQAFLSPTRDATLLVGGTGLAASPGVKDTMTGTAKLEIVHTATSIGDGTLGGGDSVSGIQLGTDTGLDTIVGQAGNHNLVVTTDGVGGGTIALDDGEPMPYDGTETSLLLTNGAGDKVHVNLTGLTSGFEGTVSLEGQANIRAGSGPWQALTFDDDFLLQDGNGRAMHLDTTDLVRGGETFAVFQGTESIFDVLIGLRDEIEGTLGLDPGERTKRIQTRLGTVDAAHEGVLTSLATLGARSASFQRVSSSLDFFELSLEEKRGELEDTDLFEASIRLAQSQTAYQGALQAAAKLLAGPTLLNFL